jgi:hypothetical protein
MLLRGWQGNLQRERPEGADKLFAGNHRNALPAGETIPARKSKHARNRIALVFNI